MWAGAKDRLQQRHLTHGSWAIHLLQGVGAEQLGKAIKAQYCIWVYLRLKLTCHTRKSSQITLTLLTPLQSAEEHRLLKSLTRSTQEKQERTIITTLDFSERPVYRRRMESKYHHQSWELSLVLLKDKTKSTLIKKGEISSKSSKTQCGNLSNTVTEFSQQLQIQKSEFFLCNKAPIKITITIGLLCISFQALSSSLMCLSH